MQKKYIPLAVCFAVLLVILAHFAGRMTAVPVFTYAEEEKKIYLTFDDGPSTVVTGRILDVLKQEKIKATFFIVSDRIYGRREVLRRIVQEGHTVGVHSRSHVYSEIYASDESLLKDINDCAEAIERVTGVKAGVYRFPGGGKKDDRARRKALIEKNGYKVVAWNAVCGDEEIPNASAQVLVQTAKETAKGKKTVVLLCHDSAQHTATAEALPQIIAHFRQEGYLFCSF